MRWGRAEEISPKDVVTPTPEKEKAKRAIFMGKQKRKGEQGEPVSWSTIAQKGVRIMKAEREAQRGRK